jgi:hypothetical protein
METPVQNGDNGPDASSRETELEAVMKAIRTALLQRHETRRGAFLITDEYLQRGVGVSGTVGKFNPSDLLDAR